MQFFALKSKLFLFFNGIKTKPPRLKDIFCRLFFLRLFRRILQITKMCKNAIFSIFKAFFHFTAKQEEINRVFFAFFICSVQLQRTLKKFIMKKKQGVHTFVQFSEKLHEMLLFWLLFHIDGKQRKMKKWHFCPFYGVEEIKISMQSKVLLFSSVKTTLCEKCNFFSFFHFFSNFWLFSSFCSK